MASSRLPGKMLLDVCGKPLVVRTAERAASARSVDKVLVATDHVDILRAVTDAGFSAVMTSPSHNSGSDRIAEAAESLPAGSIIVNVQGDEPLISAATIDRATAAFLEDTAADIATTYEPIVQAEAVFDPNIVKVVLGENGRAVYFSRSPVPFLREPALRFGSDLRTALENTPELLKNFRKHTGLYVYRREFLLRFASQPVHPLEQAEMLEQLRALAYGAVIKAVKGLGNSIGVDTEDQLNAVRQAFADGEKVVDQLF